MSALGGILVDLEVLSPKGVQSYLTELRDRFGPEIPLDVRGSKPEMSESLALMRWLKPDSRALAYACARAVERGHLLVLFAPVLPDAAVVQGLLEGFNQDELVGFTQPRFSDAASDSIWFLPVGSKPSAGQLPRQSLSLLPPHYLTTENLAACVAIRREVAAAFFVAPKEGTDFRAMLLDEMRNARRCGYRTLVMNRLVVPSNDLPAALYPLREPDISKATRAIVRVPQMRAADDWFDGTIDRRREFLVAKARRARPAERLPVLLDCRGVVGHHNGTSEAIFGLLEGLVVAQPNWDIDLVFAAEAAEYHNVLSRFSGMRITTALPDKRFAAAVCLNQPWHISTVKELHERALTLSFHILDTIAWDVVYLSNPEVDKVWHFIARHGDGLAYISTFTKNRFNFRFGVSPAVQEVVSYLSLAINDYRDVNLPGAPEGAHILVFGNNYDHKAVVPTVDLLSRAFPFRTIQALGAKAAPLHNVSVAQSGHLPASDIDRLIATAKVVVFPSHYEGFGLPVVKALAYGRNVVVRSSSLWREIAGLMRMPGHLFDFVTPHDLVRAVGQIFAEEDTPALPLGGDLAEGERPPDWSQCARRLVQLVEATLVRADAQRWYERDRAFALAHL